MTIHVINSQIWVPLVVNFLVIVCYHAYKEQSTHCSGVAKRDIKSVIACLTTGYPKFDHSYIKLAIKVLLVVNLLAIVCMLFIHN